MLSKVMEDFRGNRYLDIGKDGKKKRDEVESIKKAGGRGGKDIGKKKMEMKRSSKEGKAEKIGDRETEKEHESGKEVKMEEREIQWKENKWDGS